MAKSATDVEANLVDLRERVERVRPLHRLA